DPDPAADLGQHHEAHARAGIGHARLAPAAGDRAEYRRHRRLDAHRRGIDVGHRTAVLAVEAVLHPLEQVSEKSLIHGSPPAGDAAPTALRISTKAISWALALMWCLTLHTRYFPEWRAPAASTSTIVPARRIAPRRLVSVEPWQRTNHPASRRTE